MTGPKSDKKEEKKEGKGGSDAEGDGGDGGEGDASKPTQTLREEQERSTVLLTDFLTDCDRCLNAA